MKKIVLLLFVISTIGVFKANSQVPVDRKYISLQKAESSIFNLPFGMDTIKNVVYPEILENRFQLAPNYPDFSTIERTIEARKIAFHAWIEGFSQEYDSYYNYLIDYVEANEN
jgi:hypothetical protein